MRCANCGNDAPEGSSFCNRCGQRLRLETASPSTTVGDESQPPDWYRNLVRPQRMSKEEEAEQGLRRIETAISGNQARKWIAELARGQRVRIAYADGSIRHRSRRPWERSDASLGRYPWTSEEEGALLLIVGERSHRFCDRRDEWVRADHRVQVYVGIEDSRHNDNTGSYGVVLDITSGPELE